MVCFSPVGSGVLLTFRALALRQRRVCSDEVLTFENVSYTPDSTGEKPNISTVVEKHFGKRI